jgi:hypothetical protein
MQLFAPVKTALWLAFAASATFVFVTNFSALSLAVLALVVANLGYWLLSHPDELRNTYLAAESKAAVPGPYDKQLWRVKPKLKDMALGLALLGLGSFYFAYEAAQGKPPTRIAKLAYELFGTSGSVAFWVLLSTLLVAKGTESMLGSRSKSET